MPALVDIFESSRLAAVTAPPGSGKTLLLPAALKEALGVRMVYVLEPRRVTARLPALALGEILGAWVGYRIRLESRWDQRKTAVGYLTYGTALRMFQDDPPTPNDLVVFDEFHERSWEAELLYALLSALPNPPRVLLMTATLDRSTIPPSIPVVESDGRLHPVAVSWETQEPQLLGDRRKLAALAAERSVEMAAKNRGEQLIFLPGLGAIKATEELLLADPLSGPVDILHSSLPEKEIKRVVDRDSGHGFRRILSTDMAESSVTLPGIKVVIDSGLVRRPIRDELDLGVTLRTVGAPRSSLEQRAGRAGRLEKGYCHRLFTKADELHRSPYPDSQLEYADYSEVTLLLAASGHLGDWENLSWLQKPDTEKLDRARWWLTKGGLLSDDRLTPKGEEILRLPLSPRLSHFATEAAKGGLSLDFVTQLSMAIDSPPPGDACESLLDWSHQLRKSGRGDKRLEQTLKSRLPGKSPHGINDLERVMLTTHLRTLAQLTSDRAVCAAMEQQALSFRPKHQPREKFAVLLNSAPQGGQGPRSTVTLYHPITEETVWEVLLDQLEESAELTLDTDKGAVKRKRLTTYGRLTLEEIWDTPKPSPEVAALLLEYVTTQELGDNFETLVRRLSLLREHKPELLQPLEDRLQRPVGEENLRNTLLDAYLRTVTAWNKSSSQELWNTVSGLIPYELKQQLDQLLPTHVNLPGRRRPVPLTYPKDGPPFVKSKLQHFFGWKQPALMEGRVELVCHLLAPNGRACQITTDLDSFWRGSYTLVRKDLRGRYPKHDWPEVPPGC